MDELFLVIINSLLYVSFLLYSIKRRNYILLLISAIWTFSSVMGIFYFLNPYRIMPNEITLFPFLYLFLLVVVGSLPFIYYNERSIGKSLIVYNKTLFNGLVYILAILAFLPFLESFIQLGKSGLGNLASVYESKRHLSGFSTRGYFSSIGWFCFSIIDYFKFVVPTLLFVYMHKGGKSKLLLIGLFAAFLNPLLNNLVNGQRFYFVIVVYQFLFNLILFYNIMETKMKKIIVKLFTVTIGLFSFAFIAISISRFGKYSNDDFGTTYQFIRYIGESFCNFNTECFWIEDYTQGKNSFVGFYSYFTDEKISITDQNSITGIMTNAFHTYIGNFVMDFGLFKTFVILSILSFVFMYKSKVRTRCLNIGTIIEMSLYANILLFGTTYFIYQNGFTAMLWAVVISIIFKIVPKKMTKML